MQKILKEVSTILSFILVIVLLWAGLVAEKDKREAFETLNRSVSNFTNSTPSRIAKSVITLPEGNILIGLKNGQESYISKDGGKGLVIIQDSYIKTHMVSGIYKIKDPRLDAFAPMAISTDSMGGSLYIILFQDRGDVALEKSYARLGGTDVKVDSITTLPPDGAIKDEEYKVSVNYTQGGVKKEVIIPVIDGRFNPEGTISR